MAGEDRSLDQLWREFLVRAIFEGGGFGSDVNVTNRPLLVRPSGALDINGNPTTAVVDVGNTPGLTDAQLRAARVAVDTGLTTQVNALTDAQLRATPVAVDIVAGDSILTSSLLNRKVAEGKVFFAGKAITAGGALGTARPSFMIENPATLPDGVTANTKTLFIFLISIYSDVAQQIQYRENATLVGPTYLTPRGWNRRLAQHPAAVGKIAWDDAAPTGGTILENESRVFNTSPLPLKFETPYEVVPGTSFTVDFQSTAAQITTANGYWYEE